MKKASAGVKRLLIYGIVILCVLFVGFLTYYFAKNGEKITYNLDDGAVVYMNKGEQMALPIVHEDADKDTQIQVLVSDENILTYSDATLTFVAVKGGLASVTISTTNKHFGPYRFDVMVGDGSISNPYYISTATQLEKIGKNPTSEDSWKTTDSYELIGDIDLGGISNWTPIGTSSNPFAGRFVGNGYKMSNLVIESTESQVGFFGVIASNATVDSICLENVLVKNTSAGATVGLLAGTNFGNVSRIKASGAFEVQNASYVGGLVGQNAFGTTSASLTNVQVDASFCGSADAFGGICAKSMGGTIFNAGAVLDVDKNDDTTFGGIVAQNFAKAYVENTNAYTRPIVKNTYVVINTLANTNNAGLIVYQNSEETNDFAVTNLYVSNYGYCGQSLDLVANGKSVTKQTEMASKTQEQLQETTTFENWDFDKTWDMQILPQINIGASAEYHGEWIPGSDLTSQSEVENAILRIIENPSANITYNVKSSDAIVVDCKVLRGGEDWTPIGTTQNPFKGRFIVDQNTSLTFTNLQMSSNFENAGFFGVTENALIKNVKFTNVRISNTSDTKSQAGVLVANAISTTIQDCNFDNIVISNFANSGFVVANAIGGTTITNCHVGKNDSENTNVLQNSQNTQTLNYGGIAGLANNADILNVSIDNASIVSTSYVTEVYFGGIAGNITKTTITDGYNICCNVEDGQSDICFVGGVVGSVGDSSTISRCYNLSKIQASTSKDSYAGGIAGYNAKSGIVQTSFSQSAGSQAKYVGGIVSLNNGIVTESYSDGEYKGYDVGGLAYKNNGKITNCYTWASLVGLGSGKNYFVGGFCAYLPKGGSISLCFSTASLSGDCSLFAETSARVRYTDFGNFFSGIVGNYDPGELSNCVVVNYGSAEVQKPLIIDTKNSWIDCTDDDCRGRTANDPFALAGFTTKAVGIWQFDAGEYPTLVNVVKVS